MNNPFEFFGLTPSLAIDAKLLRSKFLEIQRNSHPDFGGESNTYSELANTYFEVLKSPEKRIQVLLELYANNSLNNNLLPADFLMEMMELNDVIDDSKSGDEQATEQANSQLDYIKSELDNQMSEYINLWDSGAITVSSISDWSELTIWYQKMKYWSRLRKNLDGINEI
jgi:DnaJ-domain-containing protein 1